MAYPLTEKTEETAASISIIGMLLIAIRTFGIIISFLICLSFHYLWRLFRIPSPWPRHFLRLASLNIGAVVKTRGKRLKHDVFYASNHITWFDILVIGGATGCTFVAQEGIANWPIIGWLCRINKTVFVSRTDRMQIGSQIKIIREAIEEKYPITIFPEGTTSDGSGLLSFKPSLFEAMTPPPKPIMVQPMLIDYGKLSAEIAWVGDETAPDSIKKLFARFGAIPVTLHFLEPFDPTDFDDRRAFRFPARRAHCIGGGHDSSRSKKPDRSQKISDQILWLPNERL